MRKTTKIVLAVPLLAAVVLVSLTFLFPGTVVGILISMERSSAGLERRSIEVDNLHIAYLEGGQGDALVLLHGFGGNKDNWTRMARYLTPRFRVILPDLAGFGESTRNPEYRYTYSDQAERVHRFAKALGLGSYHLGGNSMGGAISGTCAALYPGEIKSLWLIAPGAVHAAQPSELSRRLQSGEDNPLIVENSADYDRLMDFVFVKKPFVPGVVKRYFANEAVAHRPLNQIIFEQIRSGDGPEPLEVLLDNSKLRTLIMWGDRDRVLHVSGADVLRAVMPNADTVIMKDVGHVPMLEKPKASADAFLAFAL